jgi:hypothetical protein
MSQEPLEEIHSSLSIVAFKEPSKDFYQVSPDLTEKVITQCFLTHYYSLPWIRDYAMRMRFKGGNLEAGRNLIAVLIFYFKATRKFPTVSGLQITDSLLAKAEQFLNCENSGHLAYLVYSKPDFFETIGYRLFFYQRASEARNVNHLAIAVLWEKLVSEPPGTSVWWNIYASAKVEETKILGNVTETNYWKKETQRATELLDLHLFPAKYENTMQQNSSIIEFYKLKKMREKRISDYRVLAVAAEDNELAALWGQVSHQIEQDNLDCADYFFLAAYSLLQVKKLKQHASTIWKIASVVFQQLAEKQTVAVEVKFQVRQVACDLDTLSEMINHQIKTDLSHATSYNSKIKNADSCNLYMIPVWKKAVSYFEDNAADVANCTLLDCSDLTSGKEMFSFLKGKIYSLKRRIDLHLRDSAFNTALGTASSHMDKLLKCDLQISEWTDYGFTEISALLSEKRYSYQHNIDHYLELVQKKVRSNWSPVVDYEIDQQIDVTALSLSHEDYWDRCNTFLEIIKKYKQKATNLSKDDHQNLLSFCYQVIEEAEQCTKFVIVDNFPFRQQLDDGNIRILEKIIEFEEELLKIEDNPEKSLLQWRQNLFLKDMKLRNVDNTEEIPFKIDLFKGAKISIGYATSCYDFMSELKITEIDRFAKRFEEAADLFIHAAEETEEDLVSFYSQAATALHAAVETEVSPFKVVSVPAGREDPILAEKVDFFRWIGTQYLDAARKLNQGDKLNSKCEELKAKFLQLLSKHVNPQNYRKTLNLYRRTKDFKRLEPPLIKRWNGMYNALEKAVDTSISDAFFCLTNTWEQRADSAKRDVSEWKEKLFEYLMNAFEAGIFEEKASIIWDKVVEDAEAVLTLKVRKYRACLDKDESRLNSLRKTISRIRKKINDLIYKISSHQALEQES